MRELDLKELARERLGMSPAERLAAGTDRADQRFDRMSEVVGVLARSGGEFYIKGGVADVLNGCPRSTFDIDIVARSWGNAPLVEALGELGFTVGVVGKGQVRPTEAHLKYPVYYIVYESNGLEVDVFPVPSCNLEWLRTLPSFQSVSIGGASVLVPTPEASMIDRRDALLRTRVGRARDREQFELRRRSIEKEERGIAQLQALLDVLAEQSLEPGDLSRAGIQYARTMGIEMSR